MAPQPDGTLTVEGCIDATVNQIVSGTYSPHSLNHARLVYKKESKVNGLDVLLYYWDDRDGPNLHGWWFAPGVGGDAVWAYNPDSGTRDPPPSGWRVPYDGQVDHGFLVSPCSKRPVDGSWSEQPQKLPRVQPTLEAQLELRRQQELAALGKWSGSSGETLENTMERRKQDEAEAVSCALVVDFEALVSTLETMVTRLREAVALVDLERPMSKEVALTVTEPLAKLGLEATAGHKACIEFIVGKKLAVDDMVHSDLAKLLGRANEAGRSTQMMVDRVARVGKDKEGARETSGVNLAECDPVG
uniref:Uncharacterized protein n=1 Tax=Noctiluca scintillans TaxID=2966 RepID=A0A7S1F3T4_NOCSC